MICLVIPYLAILNRVDRIVPLTSPELDTKSQWCPFYPEYRLLVGGTVVSVSPSRMTTYDVVPAILVPKDFASVDTELRELKGVTLYEESPGYRSYWDPRGFEVMLYSREGWLKANGGVERGMDQGLAFAPGDTMIEIDPLQQKGIGVQDWRFSVGQGKIPFWPTCSFIIRGGRLICSVQADVLNSTLLGNATVCKAYLEERDQWGKTVFAMHPAIKLPHSTDPIGLKAKMQFTLEFPYKASKKPVRNYVGFSVIFGKDQGAPNVSTLLELPLWGTPFIVGQRVIARNGHLVMESVAK